MTPEEMRMGCKYLKIREENFMRVVYSLYINSGKFVNRTIGSNKLQ